METVLEGSLHIRAGMQPPATAITKKCLLEIRMDIPVCSEKQITHLILKIRVSRAQLNQLSSVYNHCFGNMSGISRVGALKDGSFCSG